MYSLLALAPARVVLASQIRSLMVAGPQSPPLLLVRVKAPPLEVMELELLASFSSYGAS